MATVGLKLLTLNVRGLNKNAKRLTLFHWLQENNIDIACLQETFCIESFKEVFNNSCSGKVIHSFTDSPHSRGVCIVLSNKLKYKLINKHGSKDGRKLLINIKIDEDIYTVVNVYAPNIIKERINFMKQLATWIAQYSLNLDNLILCGDMNCCCENKDRRNQNGDKSNRFLNKCINSLHLKDIWRLAHPNEIMFTYKDISRIDYILLSHILSAIVPRCEILSIPTIPDHRAVVVNIGDTHNRGQGYWKLNTSILDNQNYRDEIISIIQKTQNEFRDLKNPLLTWDIIKIRVKEQSIQFCTKIRMRRNKEIKILKDQIDDLETEAIIINNDADKKKLLDAKQKLMDKMDEIHINRAKAAQIRSRANYVEHGEKSTKYFLSLEKRNQTYNYISSIQSSDNFVHTNISGILNESVKFYKNLYRTKGIKKENINEYLSNTHPSILTHDEAQLCEGKIDIEECYLALKNMNKGKSPGDDGLPVEFYLTFWKNLKIPLINAYNYSFEKGYLSDSQRRAIITLVYKKGDRKLLKNYRPISLTNVDYKILAFALSYRLQKVMDKLVGSQQTAYIKNRFIGENIRTVLDILEYTEKQNIPGLMLCLDFQKAFDSLEWNFMHSVLDKFNFGQTFKKWMKILYHKPVSKLKINGWITETIALTRGIRQGCPISAMIFILCTEILAYNLNNSKDVEGIKIPQSCNNSFVEQKLLQYADDTTVLLHDELQVPPTLDIFAEFSKVSGLRLNLEKTEAMWLGSCKNRTDTFFDFQWPKVIRYLGIYVGYDHLITTNLNWTSKLEKFQKILDCWRTRDLTLFGKAAIIKTLALSKLIFSANMLTLPMGICKQVEMLIDKFLWSGRKSRLRKDILHKPINEGGISIPNIDTFFKALKASWIPRLLKEGNQCWKALPLYHINQLGQNNAILNFNYTEESHFPEIQKIPLFYQEALLAFNKAKPSKKPGSKYELLNSVVWGNRFLMYESKDKKKKLKKSLYNIHWINCGIMRLNQVLTNDCKINIEYLQEVIRNKADFICIQSQIMNAVKAYKHLFLKTKGNNGHSNKILKEEPSPILFQDGSSGVIDVSCKRANFFYSNMLASKTVAFHAINKWEKELECDIDVSKTFNKRVKILVDRKLAEFCFKLLHRVLICGEMLHSWGKVPSPLCPDCKQTHSVKHMLWECQHATFTWAILSQAKEINLSWKDVVLGVNNKSVDQVVILLAFFLYKWWIMKINEKVQTSYVRYLYFELRQKKQIYSLLKYHDTVKYIDLLLSFIQ